MPKETVNDKIKIKQAEEKLTAGKDFLHARMYYLDTDSSADGQALTEYIRKRAYYIWQGLGQPQGQEEKIWLQAEKEFYQKKQVLNIEKKIKSETPAKTDKKKLEHESLQNRLKNLEQAYHNLIVAIKEIQVLEKNEKLEKPIFSQLNGKNVFKELPKKNNNDLLERINQLEAAYQQLAEFLKCIHAESNAMRISLNNFSRDGYGADPFIDLREINDKQFAVTEPKPTVNIELYLNRIAVLEQEKIDLMAKITELEQNEFNSLDIIHAKNDLEHTAKELRKEKEFFLADIFQLKQKISELKAGGYAPGTMSKLQILQQELIRLENEISALREENQNLRKKDLEKKGYNSDAKEELLQKIDSTEKEKNRLLKIVRDAQNDKKLIGQLQEQNLILNEELKRVDSQKTRLEQKIRQLETEIRQENETIALIEPLQEQQELLQKEKKRIIIDKKNLDEKNHDQTIQIEKLLKKQTLLVEKIKEMESMQLHLNEKNTHLLRIIEKLKENNEVFKRQRGESPFDQDKLAQLKEFTLQSVRVRKWITYDFINGAYDAVNLFYRIILSDWPVKK